MKFDLLNTLMDLFCKTITKEIFLSFTPEHRASYANVYILVYTFAFVYVCIIRLGPLQRTFHFVEKPLIHTRITCVVGIEHYKYYLVQHSDPKYIFAYVSICPAAGIELAPHAVGQLPVASTNFSEIGMQSPKNIRKSMRIRLTWTLSYFIPWSLFIFAYFLGFKRRAIRRHQTSALQRGFNQPLRRGHSA